MSVRAWSLVRLTLENKKARPALDLSFSEVVITRDFESCILSSNLRGRIHGRSSQHFFLSFSTNEYEYGIVSLQTHKVHTTALSRESVISLFID